MTPLIKKSEIKYSILNVQTGHCAVRLFSSKFCKSGSNFLKGDIIDSAVGTSRSGKLISGVEDQT